MQTPETPSNFRSISLCNISYKIVAKLLASRLKEALSDIISTNQRASILDRAIKDNFMLGTEAFIGLINEEQEDGSLW